MGQCGAACMGRVDATLERRHALPTWKLPYPRRGFVASAERHIFCEEHANGQDTPKNALGRTLSTFLAYAIGAM